MSLEKNLELAQQAIEYTRATVIYGSHNRKEDNEDPHRKRMSQEAEKRIWEDLDDYRINRRQSRAEGRVIEYTFFHQIREMAYAVKCHKGGNCTFQSYVAFEWILANTDVRPVSIINMLDASGDPIHCMVAIGDFADREEVVLRDPHQIQYYPLMAFYEGEYHGTPIGARQFGDELLIRFQRKGLGTLDELKPSPADEEYYPEQPVEMPVSGASCSM